MSNPVIAGIKIFISYAWTSEEHIQKVIDLATRLRNDGIDIILDKWDLKPGNDQYQFMEQAVTDNEVRFVLLVCDQKYAAKANKREGGVGDETVLISAEVYGKTNPDKFIPLVFEYESPQTPYRPAYLKSLLYIDFSENADQEKSYEQLLRHIYNCPALPKPVLGSRPTWLDNPSDTNLSPLKRIVEQVKIDSGNNPRKIQSLCSNFHSLFLNALDAYTVSDEESGNAKVVYDKITEAKPLRDIFFEFYKGLLSTNTDITGLTTTFFENFYNHINNIQSKISKAPLEYILWECFLGATALLFKNEYYNLLGTILRHPYFLENNYRNDYIGTYVEFRNHCEYLERYNTNEGLNKISIEGYILCQREWKPDLDINDFARMDIILCQLSLVCFGSDSWSDWFPMAYIYFPKSKKIWHKLKSKSYCEKVYPLFAVTQLDELKSKISSSHIAESYRYPHSFRSIPNILSDLREEEIGSIY